MNSVYCDICGKIIARSDMTQERIFFQEFLCVGCETIRNLSRKI